MTYDLAQGTAVRYGGARREGRTALTKAEFIRARVDPIEFSIAYPFPLTPDPTHRQAQHDLYLRVRGFNYDQRDISPYPLGWRQGLVKDPVSELFTFFCKCENFDVDLMRKGMIDVGTKIARAHIMYELKDHYNCKPGGLTIKRIQIR